MRASQALVDFDVAWPFPEQLVAARLNVRDPEMPILTRGGRVIAPLLLIFGNQFDNGFLERFAAGFPDDITFQRRLARFLGRWRVLGGRLPSEREQAHEDDDVSHGMKRIATGFRQQLPANVKR